jgi:hypothetical protein
VLQRSVLAVNGERCDAASRAWLSTQRRSQNDRVKKTSIGRGTHSIAIQIVQFRTSLAEFRQRAVPHFYSKYGDAAAFASAKKAAGVSAYKGEESPPGWPPLKSAQLPGSQRGS